MRADELPSIYDEWEDDDIWDDDDREWKRVDDEYDGPGVDEYIWIGDGANRE